MGLQLIPSQAGIIIYPQSSIPQVTAAVIKFSATNTDPKANMLPSYISYQNQVRSNLLYLVFMPQGFIALRISYNIL